MIVVIDTNVVAHAIFGDDEYSQRVLGLVKNGAIEAYASKQLVGEYSRIFHRLCPEDRGTNGLTKRDFLFFFARLMQFIKNCEVDTEFTVFKDKEDNKIYNCAYEADADYIITTDPHIYETDKVLITKSRKIIEVLSPWQLLNEIDAQRLATKFRTRRFSRVK